MMKLNKLKHCIHSNKGKVGLLSNPEEMVSDVPVSVLFPIVNHPWEALKELYRILITTGVLIRMNMVYQNG